MAGTSTPPPGDLPEHPAEGPAERAGSHAPPDERQVVTWDDLESAADAHATQGSGTNPPPPRSSPSRAGTGNGEFPTGCPLQILQPRRGIPVRRAAEPARDWVECLSTSARLHRCLAGAPHNLRVVYISAVGRFHQACCAAVSVGISEDADLALLRTAGSDAERNRRNRPRERVRVRLGGARGLRVVPARQLRPPPTR